MPFFQSRKGLQGDTAVRKVSHAEAKKLMDAAPEFRIVDVREPHEYALGHISGAILFPVNTINAATAPQKLPDKEMPLFVYCQSGVRSKRACTNLYALGYNKLYNMGGITGWSYGIERGNG